MKMNDVTISSDLWLDDEDGERADPKLIFEQYKIYVEITDRISFRRILISMFFLLVNVLVISMIAIGLGKTVGEVSMTLMLLPLFGLLAQCYIWGRLARYYRHMLIIKEKVIAELEKRLPSSPIASGEQSASMKANSLIPLRRGEIYMPFIFAILYAGMYFYMYVCLVGF